MQNLAHTIAFGVFGVIALTIIYVKAGQKGGIDGGTQTSVILDSASGGAAKVIGALEGS